MKTKWNWIIVIVLAAALLLPVTTASAVATYAVSVFATQGTVQNATAALGAPDGVYATLTTSGSGIWLDMGTPVQGMITVYHSNKSPSCEVYWAPDGSALLGYTTAGATYSVFTAPSSQYIMIICSTLPKKSAFSLDAVKVGSDYAPPYAVGFLGDISSVQNPTAALGAPDGVYAIMTGTGSYFWLDMGTPVQGMITIYHSSKSPSCEVNWAPDYSLGYTTAGATYSVFTAPVEAAVSQYIIVTCSTLPKRSAFSLDAVMMVNP